MIKSAFNSTRLEGEESKVIRYLMYFLLTYTSVTKNCSSYIGFFFHTWSWNGAILVYLAVNALWTWQIKGHETNQIWGIRQPASKLSGALWRRGEKGRRACSHVSLPLFPSPSPSPPGNPGKLARRLGIRTIMSEIKRKNGKSGTYLQCGQALVNNDL